MTPSPRWALTDRLALADLEIRVRDRVLVTGVSLTLEAGRITALVGRSGSGKTLTARSLLGMVELDPGVVRADLEVSVGQERHRPWDGALGAGRRTRDAAFAGVRGRLVGYLPQDARAALDPLRRVGAQVSLAARLRDPSAGDPLTWLARAGFPDPGRTADLWPHELSGGMAQRVVIAQALARGSRFLLADEPTTALDTTVQMDILRELRALAAEGIGVLFITHDLRILPDLADEVLLMDNGRMVERVAPADLARGLLASEPGRRLVEATRRVAGGRLG